MAKVLVELTGGNLYKSVSRLGENLIKYEIGDRFEIEEKDLHFYKDKVKVIRQSKDEEETEEEEESDSSSSTDSEEIPIDRLNIAAPTIRILRSAGYNTISQLQDKTKEDLLLIPGLGKVRAEKIFEDVKAALA